MSNKYQDKIWEESPKIIKEFYRNQAKYDSLCEEVEYILKKHINDENIEVASISSRTKSLNSFCEKINRKKYLNPFTELTDLSGARVVYLYESDKNRLDEIIRSQFKILEKVDKILDAKEDEFGYGALHYIVKLKTKLKGARYEGLYDIPCEIQVRTILQDSWAIVAHHLSYKNESDVPKHLRRKLNALSGLFETADNQFEHIKTARETYRAEVEESFKTDKESSFNTEIEIELDNLISFLNWKFPERSKVDSISASELLENIHFCKIDSLNVLDKLLDKHMAKILKYEDKYPPMEKHTSEKTVYNPIGLTRVGLKFYDANFIDHFCNTEELAEDEREKIAGIQ